MSGPNRAAPSESLHGLRAFEHFAPPVAGKKAAANPRLADAAARIVETIAQQYTETIPARVPPASGRQGSNVLQLAALRSGAPTQAGSVPEAAMLAAAERDAPLGVAR